MLNPNSTLRVGSSRSHQTKLNCLVNHQPPSLSILLLGLCLVSAFSIISQAQVKINSPPCRLFPWCQFPVYKPIVASWRHLSDALSCYGSFHLHYIDLFHSWYPDAEAKRRHILSGAEISVTVIPAQSAEVQREKIKELEPPWPADPPRLPKTANGVIVTAGSQQIATETGDKNKTGKCMWSCGRPEGRDPDVGANVHHREYSAGITKLAWQGRYYQVVRNAPNSASGASSRAARQREPDTATGADGTTVFSTCIGVGRKFSGALLNPRK
ncbi:hypothetical protein DFH09DRAFT_1288923 [Mycena vulgaris]|nr:hypothetical protein DFH09DRAFT_1288923 [Mycena vulgaris]